MLAADRARWLAIDPKPVSGDPGFDVVPLLWNRWEELVATGDVAAAVRRRFDVVVDVAGIDRERARRWSVTRAVDNVLWAGQRDRTDWAAVQRTIAEALASPASPTRGRRPARPGR